MLGYPSRDTSYQQPTHNQETNFWSFLQFLQKLCLEKDCFFKLHNYDQKTTVDVFTKDKHIVKVGSNVAIIIILIIISTTAVGVHDKKAQKWKVKYHRRRRSELGKRRCRLNWKQKWRGKLTPLLSSCQAVEDASSSDRQPRCDGEQCGSAFQPRKQQER